MFHLASARDRIIQALALNLFIAQAADHQQALWRCFSDEVSDSASGVNISQVRALAVAAPQECRQQIVDELCHRLEFVAELDGRCLQGFGSNDPQDSLSSRHHTPWSGAIAAAVFAADDRRTPLAVEHTLAFRQLLLVRVAFIIFAFGAIGNLKRLVGRLRHPAHSFLVHLDQKASWRRTRELQDWASTQPQLRVLPERFDVKRGGASFLFTLLRCMEVLLAEDDQWEYVVNLNDNDYLLTSAFAFQTFLALHRSHSFVYVGSPSTATCPETATNCRKIDHLIVAVECTAPGNADARGLYSLLPSDAELPRWFYSGMPIWAGPDLVGLWRPLVERLYASLREHGSATDALLTQLRTAQQPDERFFQGFIVHGGGLLGHHSHMPMTFHVWDAERLDAGKPLQASGDPVQIYSPPLLRDGNVNYTNLKQAATVSPWIHFARKFDAKRTIDVQRRFDNDARKAVSLKWSPVDAFHGWDISLLAVLPQMISGDDIAQQAVCADGWVRNGRHSATIYEWQRLKCGGEESSFLISERLAMTPSFDSVAGDGHGEPQRLRCKDGFSMDSSNDDFNFRRISLLRFVLAVRVGVGWDSKRQEFLGPASVVPAQATVRTAVGGGGLTAVFYLSGRPQYPGVLAVDWKSPSGDLWYRSTVEVQAGVPLAWVRCPPLQRELPMPPGRWQLVVTWQGMDVRQHFLATFPPESHSGGNAVLDKPLLAPRHPHLKHNISIVRPFEIHNGAADLLSRCNLDCLRQYFALESGDVGLLA